MKIFRKIESVLFKAIKISVHATQIYEIFKIYQQICTNTEQSPSHQSTRKHSSEKYTQLSYTHTIINPTTLIKSGLSIKGGLGLHLIPSLPCISLFTYSYSIQTVRTIILLLLSPVHPFFIF